MQFLRGRLLRPLRRRFWPGVILSLSQDPSRCRATLRLHAFVVGSRSDQQAMVRAPEASSMRPVIDRHFPLEELVEAFRYRESGRHFGKIVIDI